MKIGIYIDGLGQSVAQETLIKYATRLKNEYRFHNDGATYSLKVEKIKYTDENDSNVVSIIKKNNAQVTVLYKIYEFKYGEILTGEYTKQNILYKNMMLFNIVFSKFPILLKRIFVPKGYNSTFQTFYLFSLFFIIASAILFMVPATLSMMSDFIFHDKVMAFANANFRNILNTLRHWGVNSNSLKFFSQFFVSFIAIILLLVPKANVIITGLATEFVSAHLYLQYGQQKQEILGKLDLLYEYIAENESDCKVHFHTYSFGTLVALDYLFTFGKDPSGNMKQKTEALITIGTPFDFINAYYPNYFTQRSKAIEDTIIWLNVYSIADALGSNFRNDGKMGDAEYGVSPEGLKPININYEVVHLESFNFFSFLMLNNLKVHGMYWSDSSDGQSCLNPIYLKLVELKLIDV